jgi:hypothetical protein
VLPSCQHFELLVNDSAWYVNRHVIGTIDELLPGLNRYLDHLLQSNLSALIQTKAMRKIWSATSLQEITPPEVTGGRPVLGRAPK